MDTLTASAPLERVWKHRWLGPAIRLIGGFLVLQLIVSLVFKHDPPLGIYLNGIVIGSLYSLLAMGLILIYRANRIVNFAQAGLGTASAVVALILLNIHGWPYPLVVLIVLIGSPVLGAGMEAGTVRLFHNAPRLFLTMATIGFAQLMTFFELSLPIWMARGEQVGSEFGPILGINKETVTPFSGFAVKLGGVYFSGDHFVAVVVVITAALGLAAFFRFTNIGIAVRAAAENGDRAKLLGIPVKRLSSIVWMVAGLLSGISIFLRAPIVGMPIGGALLGPGILLYALTAAVIARMDSLPMALFAGMGIGIIDQSVFYATRDTTVSNALMLPVILLALLLQRSRFPRAADTGTSTWQAVKEFRPIPAQLRGLREVALARTIAFMLVAGFFLTLPFIVGDLRRYVAILIVIYGIVGVSLVILTGWAGQISLGQWALSGAGAAVAGGLAVKWGADFFITLIVAGLAGALVSIAVGIPALRVPGMFLAITTLAFAANMQFFFLNNRYFSWLLPPSTTQILRPVLYDRISAADDLGFYYLCLAILALVVLSARALRGSRSGRVLIAARDNTRAAQAYGVNLVRTRLAAFALSGFFAALGGGLYAYLQGAVDAAAFTPASSVDVFTMTVIGGLTSIGGPLLGAMYLSVFRYLVPSFHDLQLIAQGLGIILVLRFASGGMAEIGYRVRDRFLMWAAARHNLMVPTLARFGAYDGRTAAAGSLAALQEAIPSLDRTEKDGSKKVTETV